MLRFTSLVWATFLGLGLALAAAPASAADSPAPASAPATPDLIGLGRAEVIAVLGRPTGERQRGDVLMMIYADGRRVELREGVVVAVSGGVAGPGEIIGADGARYLPGVDGRVQRLDSPAPAEPVASPEQGQPSLDGAAPVEEAGIPDDDDAFPSATEEGPGGGVLMKELEKHVEAMESPQAEEPVSPAKRMLVFALEVGFRFGLMLLILRLAVQVAEVPFFWPDLGKVAGLCLAVHAFMEGLAELGGLWEFITLFALDDIVTFIIMACSLTWFKVAGSGLTALKIAAATQFVVIGLMFAVGLAVTFGLSAMQ